jgi:hypothetical protein
MKMRSFQTTTGKKLAVEYWYRPEDYPQPRRDCVLLTDEDSPPDG